MIRLVPVSGGNSGRWYCSLAFSGKVLRVLWARDFLLCFIEGFTSLRGSVLGFYLPLLLSLCLRVFAASVHFSVACFSYLPGSVACLVGVVLLCLELSICLLYTSPSPRD